MAELLYRLGKGCSRRPWIVISSWVVVVALAGVGFLLGFRTLTNSFDIPGLPSSVVVEDLQQELPDLAGASGTVVFRTDDGTPLTDEQRSEISARVASAQDLPDVAQVVDPFAAEDEREQQAQAIEAGRQQIEQGRAQLDASQQQLDAGRQQLDAGRAQLAAALEQAQAAGAPQETVAGLQAQLSQLDQQGAALDAGQAEIDAGLTQLETQAGTLENGAQLLAHADPIRVVSEDGSTAVVNVAFDLPRLELPDESKQAVIDHFTGESVDGVEIGISTEIAQGVPKIIGGGEVTGVVVALIVLLVMLRSVVGALIPLATALTGVAIGVLGSLAFSGIVPMAVVTPVLGIMLGLAVGIDYSLFIINRHRTQLVESAELHESIGLANGTSGNAVVFAGSTVAIALFALNVTRIPFLGVMGNVGAVAVVAAVLIAITLTPALLGLAGKRVLGRRLRAVAEQAPGSVGAHIALARVLTWRRAIITVVAAVIGLLVVASPALSMRVGLPDGSSEPVGSLSQRAYVITEEEFGAGANGPLLVTAQFPEALEGDALVRAELDVADAITAVDGVVAAAPAAVAADGTMVAFQVIPDGGPNSETTAAVVRDLRGLAPVDGSITLGVAGQAATNIDISERLADILPVYLPIVAGLSLLIMIVVFRSLFVPIVATGGFLLSLFATYGVVVAVFQWGWGASLIGIHSTGPILNFLPVILVGVLFGLAMDYQLFLATGMREAYVHGADARHAVAEGFRAGRAVVIAAGLIMVSVFGGFVFADSPMIRSFGLGLAAGILFDAFVVRMLLMPALMHIAGAGAWWLPRWLDRIIPNVDVEGAALERRHKRTPQAASPQ